jgi:2,4-dienoyl-CoA reductase-like NADH-dependent reductase (Old Yellow Enzyme family)
MEYGHFEFLFTCRSQNTLVLGLETSRPGVFAVGDVRSGSMKRVASAVGEGANAVALVHVLQHFRRVYHGTLILNVGIDPAHGAELLRDGLGDLIAFGRAYIANPDLVERVRVDAPLNDQRPEGYYGSSPVGYTDYPFMVGAPSSTGANDVIRQDRE